MRFKIYDLRFKKFLLMLVFLIAFILRFWKLDSYPALNADEAAIGYNAYSLIQTGRDEHGNPWPIHFQSFNDYKPGLYFYLVLPFVKVLGLNEWAVRLPGAILGLATVFGLYLLIKELKIENSLKIKNCKLRIDEIAAFLLAISPWHLHFSRGGWEVNVGTFLITLGVLFFLKGLKKSKFLVLGSVSWVLSFYTYHSARIVVPLLGLGFLIIYRKELLQNLKALLVAGFTGLILFLPLVRDLAGPAGISRAAGVGLFADPGPINRIDEQRGEHSDFQGLIPKVFHNKAINYGLAFLENWSAHYHGEFLFLSGDVIQRNKVPETGQLYLFEILTIIVGLAVLIKNLNKNAGVILVWLVAAPTAAALTFQSPHALRAHNLVIPLTIVSATGLKSLITWIMGFKNKKLRVISYLFLAMLIFWQFARYQHLYWVHMAKEYPYSSQYGVKELVSYVRENQEKYQKIVVTDRYDQPYILFLFYLKYPPEKFQDEHLLTARDKYGFSTVRDFDKFVFIPIDHWSEIRSKYPNSLIAGTPEEIPKEANIIKDIYGTNGFKYFRIVAN